MSRTHTDGPAPTDSMVTVPLSETDIMSPTQSKHLEDTPTTERLSISIDVTETPEKETENKDEASTTIVQSPQDYAFKKEEQTATATSISTPKVQIQEVNGRTRGHSITSSTSSTRSRTGSESSMSPTSASVDWAELDKSEEQEPRSDLTDESTALLLARLEQENSALASNPKSGLIKARKRSQSRPLSIQQLKKLVDTPQASLRYSQLPTPQMTELEFWAALVQDYPQTAQRLPTLTSNKIRAGVPPPLRGVVWPSIAGACSLTLQDEFNRLCNETSPYENLIGKDIGRSFPNVEMFREKDGEGQQMLGRVLRAFSLYDEKIGYCQGLGFVVGPLLMHMSDAQAFAILVRLMDNYDLRTCFLPDLSGLHLRIYQFQQLLARHLPSLSAHLEELSVEPLYISQWFLSFFAVTCPLPMLLRIYDVLLLEGACETLMRVALSLMQRNEKKLQACTEFEDVMQLLLSRSLWDTYAFNADELVNDFVSLTGLVTRDSLMALETTYNETKGGTVTPSVPLIQAAASRFLGRLWAGSGSSTKSVTLNPGTTAATSTSSSRPNSTVRRTPSKQSMASTLNSVESGASDASTALTDVSTTAGTEIASQRKSIANSVMTQSAKDKDLHGQIEDLLIALGDMQREQAALARELQKEREEREEDQAVAKMLLSELRGQQAATEGSDSDGSPTPATELLSKAASRFSLTQTAQANKRVSMNQTKHQLRADMLLWKSKFEEEATRSAGLTRSLDTFETEHAQVKEQLREARARIQDGHRERQKLEKVIQDLKSRKFSDTPSLHARNDPFDSSNGNSTSSSATATPTNGLREFKLSALPPIQKRSNTNSSQSSSTSQSQSQSSQNFTHQPPQPPTTPPPSNADNLNATPRTSVFSKRTSSLLTTSILPSTSPAADETLLLELVNAKTAEALARQELEEVKGKLEGLRRLVQGKSTGSGSSAGGGSASGDKEKEIVTPSPGSAPAGGFFSGWGRRTASTNAGASS